MFKAMCIMWFKQASGRESWSLWNASAFQGTFVTPVGQGGKTRRIDNLSKGTARRSGSVERGTGRASAREEKTALTHDSPTPASVTTAPGTAEAGASGPGVSRRPNGNHAEQLPFVQVEDPSLLSRAGLPMAPALPTTSEYLQIRTSRRRRLMRFAIFLVLIALIAETAWLSPFTDGAATAVPRTISAIPLAEVQPYGVNTFLHKEVESFKKEKTFEAAEEMGVGWIKQQFPWAEIEYRTDPDRPYWDTKNNQNAWTKFDDIVARAQQHNMRVIARIDSAPPWARHDGSSPKAPPATDKLNEFGAFVSTFVARYRGTVAAIQVWNEPNLRGEWDTGRPVNAAEYVEMLKVAYNAAKQANPDIIVLAAPLATNNETLAYNGNLNELDYLQGMYDAGAGAYFDAMAANAYGTTFPPEAEPSRSDLNFRRVELLRDVMVQNGDASKSVWFNEYGWNASPASITNQPWGSVTPEQQGEYTVRGIQYAREHWPWAGVFTIWYLRQVGDIPATQSDYYFMLVDPDFVNQPAYRAIQRVATVEDRVAMPGSWGPLSAPVNANSTWVIGLSGEASGGMYLHPSTLGISLNVQFTGTDISLQLVPASNTGVTTDTIQARYYVSIDGSSRLVSNALPRDASGAAYIDIPAVSKATEVVIARSINSELKTSQHTLTINVTSNPTGAQPSFGGRTYAPVMQRPDLPGIGAFTVKANRSYIVFALLTLGLLIGCAYLVWSLRKPPPMPETAAAGR